MQLLFAVCCSAYTVYLYLYIIFVKQIMFRYLSICNSRCTVRANCVCTLNKMFTNFKQELILFQDAIALTFILKLRKYSIFVHVSGTYYWTFQHTFIYSVEYAGGGMNLILSNLYPDKSPSFLQVMKQIISIHSHTQSRTGRRPSRSNMATHSPGQAAYLAVQIWLHTV